MLNSLHYLPSEHCYLLAALISMTQINKKVWTLKDIVDMNTFLAKGANYGLPDTLQIVMQHV